MRTAEAPTIQQRCEALAAQFPGWRVWASDKGRPGAARSPCVLPVGVTDGDLSLLPSEFCDDPWLDLERQLARQP